jgi:hypothetical protein
MATVFILPIAVGLITEITTTIPFFLMGGGDGTPTGPGFHGDPMSAAGMGASSSSMAIMMALISAPLSITFTVGLGGAMAVSGIMASELNAGSPELWLSRITPAAILQALTRVIFLVIGVIWLIGILIVAVTLSVLILVTGHSLTMTAGFVAFNLVVPLLLALSGSVLAIGVGLWKPRLAQVSNGLVHGQGAVLIIIALLPSLILGTVSMAGLSSGLSILVVSIIGVGLSVILAVIAAIVGATRISREALVSSL